MRLARILLVAWALAFAGDAGAAETPTSEKPPAGETWFGGQTKAPPRDGGGRASGLLEKCRQRDMHTGCSSADGNLMPCPCHCD